MPDYASTGADLVKNNLNLQKVTLDLVEAVKNLTARIDKMVTLFEEASKKIDESEVDPSLHKKLEVLLEQNKVIARGLVILEDYIKNRQAAIRPSSMERRL